MATNAYWGVFAVNNDVSCLQDDSEIDMSTCQWMRCTPEYLMPTTWPKGVNNSFKVLSVMADCCDTISSFQSRKLLSNQSISQTNTHIPQHRQVGKSDGKSLSCHCSNQSNRNNRFINQSLCSLFSFILTRISQQRSSPQMLQTFTVRSTGTC